MNSTEDNQDLTIKLEKSGKLIDDSFVFIQRDRNASVLIKDYDKLAERYADCFYRNENSAVDICDGSIVSGGLLIDKSIKCVNEIDSFNICSVACYTTIRVI